MRLGNVGQEEFPGALESHGIEAEPQAILHFADRLQRKKLLLDKSERTFPSTFLPKSNEDRIGNRCDLGTGPPNLGPENKGESAGLTLNLLHLVADGGRFKAIFTAPIHNHYCTTCDDNAGGCMPEAQINETCEEDAEACTVELFFTPENHNAFVFRSRCGPPSHCPARYTELMCTPFMDKMQTCRICCFENNCHDATPASPLRLKIMKRLLIDVGKNPAQVEHDIHRANIKHKNMRGADELRFDEVLMTHLVDPSGGSTAPGASVRMFVFLVPAAGGEGYEWLNEGRISPKQYCINLPAFSVVPPRCYYDLADFGLVIGCLFVTFATHTELVCFVKPIHRCAPIPD
ncbi:hypothetical protein SprV_0702355500 [Sparganum proliferum]